MKMPGLRGGKSYLSDPCFEPTDISAIPSGFGQGHHKDLAGNDDRGWGWGWGVVGKRA